MASLVVLDVLLLAGNLSLFFYVLRRLASPVLRDVVYGVSLVAAFGLELFSGEFFQSETVGSFLLLLALAAALRFRCRPGVFVLIGALLALAGQVKEDWFLCIIPFAIFALVGRPKRWQTLACLAVGWVSMLGLVLGGLLAVGALGAYADVLAYKATRFPVPGLFTAAREIVKTVGAESSAVFLLWPMLPIVVAFAVYLRSQALGAAAALRELAGFQNSILLLSVLTWACLILGYVWDGAPVQGHSFVILYLPFMFVAVLALVYISDAFSAHSSWRVLHRRVGMAAVLFLLLIPSPTVAAGLGDRYKEATRSTPLSTLLTLESPASMQRFSAMESHLHGTGCLQVAYGWDSGAAYIYTGANPCSRYFLANLLTTTASQDEFRREMTTRPPDVIVYETDMANLDIVAFEKTVFPYSSVLAECYSASSTPTVFVARYDPAEQSRCIGDQLRLAGLAP
jgi:hypothetical protein